MRSLFEENSSKSGGAIRSNSDSFWITNSTFVGNSALGGGALNSRTGAMTVVNSTFAGNLASVDQQTMLAETVQGASLIVRNSIIWTPDTNDSFLDCDGVSDGGGNVQWYGDEGTGFSGSCPGVAGFPYLNSLQDNGGYTRTMAPEYFSITVDAGLIAHCPAADQTGRLRDNNGNCDAGAYDQQTTANAAPTTSLGENTFVLTYDYGTTAVDLAAFFADAETTDGNLIYEIVSQTDPAAVGVAINGGEPSSLIAGIIAPPPGPASTDVTIRARPRAIGAQRREEARPGILEGAPRAAGVGQYLAKAGTGLHAGQTPGQQQGQQRRQQPGAQEVELDGPVIAHRLVAPAALFAGQIGNGHEQ